MPQEQRKHSTTSITEADGSTRGIGSNLPTDPKDLVDIDKRYAFYSLNGGKNGIVWFDRDERVAKSDPPWIVKMFEKQFHGAYNISDGVKFFRRMVMYNNGYNYFSIEEVPRDE